MISKPLVLSLVLLVINGASACVPCLEAHRHALAQSFGFDYGITYNYNIVAQGAPFAITSGDDGVIVADQESGRCHFAKRDSVSGGAHGELAFNIGSGMQWSSAGRICSWPRTGGPVIVKPVDETPPENTFTGLGLSGPGVGIGVTIEIHGYIYYNCDDDLCAYPTGVNPPEHCKPTTLTTTPPRTGVDVPGNYAPLTPLFPPAGSPPVIPTGPPALQVTPPNEHTSETPPSVPPPTETTTGENPPSHPPSGDDNTPPPQHSYPVQPPPENNVQPPPTNNVQPPPENNVQPPPENNVQTPPTNNVQPPPTNNVQPPSTENAPPSPPQQQSPPSEPSTPPFVGSPPAAGLTPPSTPPPVDDTPPTESTPPISETPPTSFVTPGRNTTYTRRHNETGHYRPMLPRGAGMSLHVAPCMSLVAGSLFAVLLLA